MFKRWSIVLAMVPFLIGIMFINGISHPSQSQQNAIFIDSGQLLANETTLAVAAADLDGDTDLDVFAANSFWNKVWLNNGNGLFTANGQFFGTGKSEGVALADLDNDDDIDAVVANSLGYYNKVWLNDGNGMFIEGQIFTGTISYGVAVANLNADSYPDIYFTGSGMDQIWWNDGNAEFTNSGQILETNTGYDVELEDLDGDGDVDAFIANGSASQYPDTVWINQGGDQGGTEGDFLDSGQTLGFIWTYDAALGNLDGVSGLDAFTASWFPNPNKVWLNDGAGIFTDTLQNLGSAASIHVSLGDVDKDLDLDAFVGNNFPDGGKLWLNDGAGIFTDSGENISLDTTVNGSVLADFNNDGALDLFLGIDGPNQVWFNTVLGILSPTVDFQPQIVDPRGETGESTSLALDKQGFPHIAYTRYQLHRDGLDYTVWYTWWDGVQWHRENVYMVTSIGNTRPYATAIALDSQGNPVIAFVADTSLFIARRMGDYSWNVSEKDVGLTLNPRVSMALDSEDNPHLVNVESFLTYWIFDGSNWNAEIVDPNQLGDLYPNLVLDSDDNPHISYYGDNDYSIQYAQRVGGNWQTESIETIQNAQDYPYTSIALDSNGYPNIAYNWNDERTIKLASWNGSSWDIQVVDTIPLYFELADRNALAFDSLDQPHIVYVPSKGANTKLRHIFWDGNAWTLRVIDNSANAGGHAAMALDANDNVHVSYFDATYNDLRYAAWGSEFETVAVEDSASIQATALGIRDGAPTIGYYDLTSGLVKAAAWQDGWVFDPFQFSSNPILEISSVTQLSNQHFSYYDADNQRLLYTKWNNEVLRQVVVDDVGDVGQFNDITFVGGDDTYIRIAYWDATNHRIKLAELNSDAPPVIHMNDQTPALNAASGYVSIAPMPEGNVGVSYYDGVNGDLRYATWNSATNTWTDRFIDGLSADVGRMNDVQVDTRYGIPVIAYYDETNDQIKFTYEDNGAFSLVTAVADSGPVTSLSLALNLNSWRHARILYTTTDNHLYLASLKAGIWQVKILNESETISPKAVSLTLSNRLHFAYTDQTGLMYGFQTSNLIFAGPDGAPPQFGDGLYNPMDGCIAVLNLFLDNALTLTETAQRVPSFQVLSGPLTDPQIFTEMASLFNASEGGQYYTNLYLTHGTEMGAIGLDDPELLWDSYGTLQNFIPGLEALVTGDGDGFLISQDMTDDALDIWQRIAASASPQLADGINTELARYNNLQDFVGMSFDEWATTLGVELPPETIFLPVIEKGP